MGDLWSFRIQCDKWSGLTGMMLKGGGSYKVRAQATGRRSSGHVKRIANKEILQLSRIQYENHWNGPK
jgi:hypothetical protein